MNHLKIQKHKQSSLLKGLSSRAISISSEQNKTLLFSLKYFDKNQGQSFSTWESKGLLSQAMETIRNYCTMTPEEAKQNNFNIYGDFPSQDKTIFTHPKHVPEDANWCSMHIKGKECLAGHIHHNVFYIVFLDIAHQFYKTEKKNT